MPNLDGGTASKTKKTASKATPKAKKKVSKVKRTAIKAEATEKGRITLENDILSSLRNSLACTISRLDETKDTLVQIGKKNKKALTKAAENYELTLQVPMKFNAQQLSKAIELAKLTDSDQKFVRKNITKEAASQVKATIRAFVADVKPPETKHSLKSRR